LNSNNENYDAFSVVKIMKNNESENHENIMKNNANNEKLEKNK
jgi:hypothetical protein